MGGRAFKDLSTPRISREIYVQVREQVTKALREVFSHVVVPAEIPSKKDYGDIDYLVGGPLAGADTTTFNYEYHIEKIKSVLNTPYGRKAFLTERIMYFAVPAPIQQEDEELYVQIDVKVCERLEFFDWEQYQLLYASHAKIIGSMIKPLGLTIDPEGLYLRVEGLEKVNLEKSMIFLSREPKQLLKIVGLDKRILNTAFKDNEELFEYLARSWLFNPAHFAERLKDHNYIHHLVERSAPYVAFVKEWIPDHYPDYRFKDGHAPDFEKWCMDTRATLRDKVLAMYPSVAAEYYTKRGEHLQDVEEYRLRQLIMSALPVGLEGWSEDLPQPPIIIKPSATPQTPLLGSVDAGPLMIDSPCTIASSMSRVEDYVNSSSGIASPTSSVSVDLNSYRPVSPLDTPLYIESLPRDPPTGQSFSPRPPPQDMSMESKLLCLARWTRFDAAGMPYLASEPREKKFEMDWAGSGAEDAVLVQWATTMWWPIWQRQFRVNYVGMWKKRFEKEDKKMERREAEMDKVMRRFKEINEKMGMVVLDGKLTMV